MLCLSVCPSSSGVCLPTSAGSDRHIRALWDDTLAYRLIICIIILLLTTITMIVMKIMMAMYWRHTCVLGGSQGDRWHNPRPDDCQHRTSGANSDAHKTHPTWTFGQDLCHALGLRFKVFSRYTYNYASESENNKKFVLHWIGLECYILIR